VFLALSLAALGSGASLVLWAAIPTEPALELTLVDQPVVQLPPVFRADKIRLRDKTQVIGVSAGRRHRAYLIEALVPLETHVVNDLLGEMPVTVSFCDRKECVRVFADQNAHAPLAVSVGGWVSDRKSKAGSMLLRVGEDLYRQDVAQPVDGHAAGPFPYVTIPFERTSWKEWYGAHPDTDVYVGDLVVEPAGGEARNPKPE
jgi:hypothetical protein